MLIGNLLLQANSRIQSHPCAKVPTMEILLDVLKVSPGPEYKLFLEFENGEKRVFDMAPYMNKKPFISLKPPSLFAQAFVDYGTVVWPGNIDIAPETLYDRSVPVQN